MPKQNYILDRFDGGINTHFNEKDIPDNSLVQAENIMVDRHGKIRVMGASEDSELGILTGTTFPGFGIFSFQSDYDNPDPSVNLFSTNGNFDISGTNAEVNYLTSNTTPVFTTWQIYGNYTSDGNPGTNTGWRFESQTTTTTTNHPSNNPGSGWHLDSGNNKMICNKTNAANRKNKLYRNLGANSIGKTFKITVTSRRLSSSSNNKFRLWAHKGINSVTGEEYSNFIEPTDSDVSYSAIVKIGEGANGNIGVESNNSSDVNFDITEVIINQLPSLFDTKYIAMQDENEVDIRDLSNNQWRNGLINLDKDNLSAATDHPSIDTKPIYYIADGILRVVDSNFNNSNTISKRYGIINRTNFSDTSGNAQFLEWLSSDQKLYSPSSTTHASGEDHNPGKVTAENDDGSDSYPQLATIASDGLRFHFGIDDSPTGLNGTWTGTFEFYVSFLYDLEKQESGLFSLTSKTVTATNRALACAFSVDYHDGSSLYRFNKRVTGARIYYTDADDSSGIFYQLLEVDFVLGCKKFDDLSFVSWTETTVGQNAICPSGGALSSGTTTQSNSFHFLHPPKVLTYQAINGYEVDEDTIFKYKTAVIANRRCYIGNIGKLDKTDEANNIVEKFNDRIIKSPVNKFDTFPESNFLDVTVNDGDEIIRLETFADRLLQYKRQKLFIINISQDIEFLESEHNFMGIDHHSAVTKTELGVIWTNKRGCYIYDGSQIKNLITSKISQTQWSDFLTTSGMIGYIPAKKQIAVFQSPTSTSGNIYVYDFITESWTFGSNILSSGTKTNIATSFDGDMIYGEYVSNSNDANIIVGTDYNNANVEPVPGIAPSAKIILRPGPVAGFRVYGAQKWRLVLARSSNASLVQFDANLNITGSTADALTDVLEADSFGNNINTSLNFLKDSVNSNTSSTYWEAETINTALKFTYTGDSSRWSQGGAGSGIGNSGNPAAKALVLLVKTDSGQFKLYSSQLGTGLVVAESDNTDVSVNNAHNGVFWKKYFDSIPLTSRGLSPIAQVTQLSFLNMPGSNASNLSGPTFDFNIKQFNSFNDVEKDVSAAFIAGQDLTDYGPEGGFDTGVVDAFDTNEEFAKASRAILASNPDLNDLTFGAVTDSSVQDNINNGNPNIHFFNITGPADGRRFEVSKNIFNNRKIAKFRNIPNQNNSIRIITKDIDFRQPGIKKIIYKVYVTFRTMDSDFDISQTYTKLYYQINGTNVEQNPKEFDFSKSINYGESTYGLKFDESTEDIATITLTKSGGLNNTDITSTSVNVSNALNIKQGDAIKINTEVMLVTKVDVENNTVDLLRSYQSGQSAHLENATILIYPKTKSYTAQLIPSSPIKNAYSFQLMIESASGTPANFEIEDITIVYRTKSSR